MVVFRNTDANKCSVERLVSPEYRDQNVILFTNGLTIAGAMDRWEVTYHNGSHYTHITTFIVFFSVYRANHNANCQYAAGKSLSLISENIKFSIERVCFL